MKEDNKASIPTSKRLCSPLVWNGIGGDAYMRRSLVVCDTHSRELCRIQ